MDERIIWEIFILVFGLLGGYVAAVLGGCTPIGGQTISTTANFLKTEKSKRQALVTYNRIKAFHEASEIGTVLRTSCDWFSTLRHIGLDAYAYCLNSEW